MHFPENISGSEPRYEDSPSRLGNKGVAAFDVFETALVRAVGSPQAVFRLLGQRLAAQGLISCPPEIFARARIQAESRAHNYSGGGISATLAGIYAELGSALSDLGATPEQLMQAECRLEAELLRPVPETRRRILAARQQGKRIVFISDMYLPADFIFGQLLKHQLAEPGDGCYVSSEQRLWKCDGGLFREVLKRENILPGATCFLGNNLAVDVGPAVQLGISAEYFPSGNLNRYEEVLESQSWATGGLTSALAGASRLARLNVMADSVKTAAIRDFAASVVAPTLISYTIWLLRQAQKRGLTRLYFLARDGEVLLKLAKILAPKLQINCELRYLYGSRKAWGMAAIVNGDADELAWLLEGDPGPDLSRLLSRLDIAPTAIQSALEKLGFDAASWNKRFSTAELARIKSREFLELIRSPVVKTSVRRRDLLLAYLEQEGLLTDSQYGLVDVGWHATLQDCLARILATRHKEIGMGFYFGLTGYQTAEKFGAKHAYFMDAQRQLGFPFPMPDLFYLIETMCAGTEGTLSAFNHDGNGIKPVLKCAVNTAVDDWGLATMHQTVETFAEHLVLDPSLISTNTDARPAVARTLETFWRTPTTTEAQIIADFPFEGGMDGDVPKWLAAKAYSWSWVARSLIRGRQRNEAGVFWREGSLALTTPVKKNTLRLAEKLGRFFRDSKNNPPV